MRIKKEVSDLLINAIKTSNIPAKRTLRAVKANFEVLETSDKEHIVEQDYIDILLKMVKERKQSYTTYFNNNRVELGDIELEEIEILNTLLPKPLSHDELVIVVQTVLNGFDAPTMKDMGEIMKQVKLSAPNADGKEISKIVRNSI